MNEKLKKIASGVLEAVDLLKVADTQAEGITKLEAVAKEITDTPAEEKSEELQKVEQAVEEIKKWAYISIDAQTVKDLVDQFGELKDTITKKTEKIEKLEEKIEKLEETPEVKQVNIEKTGTKSPFSGLFGGGD